VSNPLKLPRRFTGDGDEANLTRLGGREVRRAARRAIALAMLASATFAWTGSGVRLAS